MSLANRFMNKKGEYQDFPPKNFCLTVPIFLNGNPSVLCFRKKAVARKFLDKSGEYQNNRSKIFCLETPETFGGGTFLCFKNFLVGKNFVVKGGGSRFVVENVLSHTTEKVRRETLPSFRKNLESKKNTDFRGAGYHDFPSKLFCFTVPNLLVEEPFCVSQSFGYRKFYSQEGISQFSKEKLLSHSVEIFRRGTFLCFRKILKTMIFSDKRAGRKRVSRFSVKSF